MEATKTVSRGFAGRVLAGEGLAADIVKIAAANALLILCAQIAIPLPWTPVPITGQTLGVLLVAVLLGARRGAIALGLYLLEGAAGLPVFQPYGLPAAARFLGPTAGYLMSYPLAAFVTGWIIERRRSAATPRYAVPAPARLLGALLAGEAIIFAAGCVWLAAWSKLGLAYALQAGALPFLPGEVIKLAVVMLAAGGLELARQSR
ncbi:MAG: biotin transporter BioY [Candidatus Acidiferrales bacterium]|jgi:biotin transport system substrate-specific component